MTIETTNRSIDHPGDGSLTVFSYNFKVFSSDDLMVTLVDSSGAGTVQTIGAHYSVDGVGSDNGGNVVMVTAPAIGETLIIERYMILLQESRFSNLGALSPRTFENLADKLVMMMQQVEAVSAREEFTSLTLPTASWLYRGRFVDVRDAVGPTVTKRCVEGATDGTWAWKDVVSGNPW